MANLGGRPTIFTKELADRICERLAKGESLRSICRDEDMPARNTVHSWAINDVNGFLRQYEAAREIGLDEMADELLDIADDGTNDWMPYGESENEGYRVNGEHIQRSRLRTDVRKWYLSKIAPKRYGDKIEHDHKSSDGTMTTKPTIIQLAPLKNDDSADQSTT